MLMVRHTWIARVWSRELIFILSLKKQALELLGRTVLRVVDLTQSCIPV